MYILEDRACNASSRALAGCQEEEGTVRENDVWKYGLKLTSELKPSKYVQPDSRLEPLARGRRKVHGCHHIDVGGWA